MENIKRKLEQFTTGINTELVMDENKSLIDEAICQICLNLSLKPVSCKNCGKLFCSFCIDNWTKKSKSCPNCKAYNFENPPRILMNFLNKIRLKCKYSDCKFNLNYGDFENHINFCEFGNYLCYAENCLFNGTKNEVIFHLKSCIQISENCDNCGLNLPRKFLFPHKNICEVGKSNFLFKLGNNNSNKNIDYENIIRELKAENRELSMKLNNLNQTGPQKIERLTIINKDENIPLYKQEYITSLIQKVFDKFKDQLIKIIEEIQENLNLKYGSNWSVIITRINECNSQISYFNHENIKVNYKEFSVLIFRSAKVLDGFDYDEEQFDIMKKTKNITKDIIKDIKILIKDSKLKYPNSLKERGEYIVKFIEDKYGLFWTIIIGGHFTKVTSFWLDQYIEFYFDGILYILFRSSPEENLIENEIIIKRKDPGIDSVIESNIIRLIKESSKIYKKDLFKRCEYITLELNKHHGKFWCVNTLIWGSSFTTSFLIS